MASKRDRRVAFADDVDTDNKKARSDDQPSSNAGAFKRSGQCTFSMHGNVCIHIRIENVQMVVN